MVVNLAGMYVTGVVKTVRNSAKMAVYLAGMYMTGAFKTVKNSAKLVKKSCRHVCHRTGQGRA